MSEKIRIVRRELGDEALEKVAGGDSYNGELVGGMYAECKCDSKSHKNPFLITKEDLELLKLYNRGCPGEGYDPSDPKWCGMPLQYRTSYDQNWINL